MKMKIKKSVMMFIIVVSVFLLISERDSTVAAVSNALSVCGDVLIPSLFPFMVLSSFAMNTGVFEPDGKMLSIIMNKLFRLPAESFPALLFGFIGGYPVGARVIGRLYDEGKINESDASHLFMFCVNAGPAFAVSVAGSMLTGSKAVGYVVLFSVCISSLLIGIVYGRLKKKKKYILFENTKRDYPITESIVTAVSSSCSSILSVCGWVLAFSAASSIVRQFIVNEKLFLVYDAVSEVTSGLTSAAKFGSIPFVAACVSFGGICVLCQVAGNIKKCGMKIYEYLLFRIINSILTFFVCKIILSVTDITVAVYSDMQPAIHFAPASAALMIMCAVLIADMTKISKGPCLS